MILPEGRLMFLSMAKQVRTDGKDSLVYCDEFVHPLSIRNLRQLAQRILQIHRFWLEFSQLFCTVWKVECPLGKKEI